PVRAILLRYERYHRAADPRARRLDLFPRGLEVGIGAAARRQYGLASREWLHQRRLDWLQRRHDPQHPRPRLADASHRFDGLDDVDQWLSVRDLLRAELRAVRALVRS